MAKLVDTIGYIISNYPDNIRHELSNARLTKMVYLSDWKHVLSNGSQISDIDWYFDNYGPFVWDIEREAKNYPNIFKINNQTNAYGKRKKTYSLYPNDQNFLLTDSEKAAVDHIIDVTKKLFWDDFIQLVYSTHPVSSSERYTYLNLVGKGDEYRALRNKQSVA
jgi:hypothetical protein